MSELQTAQTEEVKGKALALPDPGFIVINNHEQLQDASDKLDIALALKKEIDSVFEPMGKKAYASWKAIKAEHSTALKPVNEFINITKEKMRQFKIAENRRRAEEARRRSEMQRRAEEERRKEYERLQEEARKKAEEEKLAAAVEAEESGDEERAEKILESEPEPVFVPPVAAPSIEIPEPEEPKIDGLSFRDNWKAEVIDENIVPREYMIPDIRKINKVVKAMKGKIEIPGVRIWNDPVPVKRS